MTMKQIHGGSIEGGKKGKKIKRKTEVMSGWLRNKSGGHKKQENQLGDYQIIVILRTKDDENLSLVVIGNEKTQKHFSGWQDLVTD